MSQYEFTTGSGMTKDGVEVPVTYSFDVDEDGAQLYEAIVGDMDMIALLDDPQREALEVECLERMAADRADNAVYQAEAAEASSNWKREWESNYER